MVNLDDNLLLYEEENLAIYVHPELKKEHILCIGKSQYTLREKVLKTLSDSQGRILQNIQLFIPEAYSHLIEEKISALEVKRLIDKAYNSKKNLTKSK